MKHLLDPYPFEDAVSDAGGPARQGPARHGCGHCATRNGAGAWSRRPPSFFLGGSHRCCSTVGGPTSPASATRAATAARRGCAPGQTCLPCYCPPFLRPATSQPAHARQCRRLVSIRLVSSRFVVVVACDASSIVLQDHFAQVLGHPAPRQSLVGSMLGRGGASSPNPEPRTPGGRLRGSGVRFASATTRLMSAGNVDERGGHDPHDVEAGHDSEESVPLAGARAR